MAPLSKTPILYVTSDIERAMGMAPSGAYRIASYRTPAAEIVRKSFPDFVTLIESTGTQDDSLALLRHEAIHALVKKTGAAIVVFKNNAQIESYIHEQGWTLLNPSAALAEKVENKISQVEWLGELAQEYLPTHSIHLAKEFEWHDNPFVIQWAHGHTGETTVAVRSHQDLMAVQQAFPERTGRMSSYVHGPSFTVNAVVADGKTLVGNINYQITGVAPFTDNEFSTIGNDWSVGDLLSAEEIQAVGTMVQKIGGKLAGEGWKGLFGVDFMRDDEQNKIILIEINARQPAGATFESFLQEGNKERSVSGITIFEAHVKALRGQAVTDPLIPVNDGAQIVQRITKTTPHISRISIEALHSAGYMTVEYPNTVHNSHILRIQSKKGIMERHGKFNRRGKEILDLMNL